MNTPDRGRQNLWGRGAAGSRLASLICVSVYTRVFLSTQNRALPHTLRPGSAPTGRSAAACTTARRPSARQQRGRAVVGKLTSQGPQTTSFVLLPLQAVQSIQSTLFTKSTCPLI